jgi:hypothetical protein
MAIVSNMTIVTNGKKFRIALPDGTFERTISGSFSIFTGYVTLEFDTRWQAEEYVKKNTWKPVDDKPSKEDI